MAPPIGAAFPLPMPANVTVSIYRTTNAASPYSLGSLAASSIPALLAPKVQVGRYGTASFLKWTHMLCLPQGTDIRDAYNSQLNTETPANADTVIAVDSVNPSNLTAYYVVFVDVEGRGTALQYVRAFLDRFQPNAWPNDAI